MTQPTLLAEAWRKALTELGAEMSGAVLLGGRDVERVALELGAPVRESGPTLVLMGDPAGSTLPADGSPMETGLEEASVDSVAMLGAWRDGPGLEAVALEAARVVRSGGDVWLGDLDAEALVKSTPALYPAALLYRARPDVAEEVMRRHEGSGRLVLAASRARLQPVTMSTNELPWAAFGSVDECVETVRAGVWPGSDLISDDDLDALLGRVRALCASRRFPTVESLPWLLAHGRRHR